MSATAHKGLADALLAFQAEAPTLAKDATNPHFRSRYTPLDTIVETIRPLLAKHSLVWTALPGQDEQGRPVLGYRLIHAPTNEEIVGTMPLLLPKSDSQGLGSALTYSRRYALSAVLNLVADEDDDGNGASPRQPSAPPRASAAAVQSTERLASAKQRGLINARAGDHNMPASVLANVVLVATGNDPREFQSEAAAQSFLQRGLDRLPAASVNAVLKGIEDEVIPDGE